MELVYLYENHYIENTFSSYNKLIYHIENTKELHKYFESSFGKIKPNNYCGFLNIENQSYFIAPKITENLQQDLNIFIYMLLYTYDIKLSHEDFMRASNHEHSIFEIFIRLFSDALLAELKKGIFKQYITLEENLKVLRGRYVVEKNFRNFYHQNIYCEFDEFSMDNELNRFFLFAIRTFKKYSKHPNLSRCEMVLDEVESFNIDFNRLNIHFDRMNSRYKKSYEIALMILQKLVPTTSKSKSKSFAFLFKMYDVFEGFVGKMYKEIDSTTALQYSRSFGKLQLRPDIMTSDKVIDLKYKIYDKNGVKRDDKYQMYAYGRCFNKDTMIVYPKHLNDVCEVLELGEGEEMVKLELKSLDLWFSGGYEEFLNEIKTRLEGMR